MDMERLPSGKFETNELVLELAILAYNILRMIGQESIGRKGTKTKHKVRRRRLRTVIGNMIMMASHVTEHALLKGFLVLLTVIWNQNQSRYIKILSLKNYLSRISQSDLGLAS
ncbi:Uncharacterised protein [Enterocloster clostridioformis]|nr:Uncharacterised protein [Enterocloster clostridioformis]